jgi:DNA replication protein DnaC
MKRLGRWLVAMSLVWLIVAGATTAVAEVPQGYEPQVRLLNPEVFQVGTYFIAAHDLVNDLRRAHAENRLERRLRVYLSPRLLIIDEMGYIPFGNMEAQGFVQLISKRYERDMSLILTSNKSYDERGSVFGDSIIAAAILDRLLHRSTTVNIRGESYWLREKRKAGILASTREVMPAK